MVIKFHGRLGCWFVTLQLRDRSFSWRMKQFCLPRTSWPPIWQLSFFAAHEMEDPFATSRWTVPRIILMDAACVEILWSLPKVPIRPPPFPLFFWIFVLFSSFPLQFAQGVPPPQSGGNSVAQRSLHKRLFLSLRNLSRKMHWNFLRNFWAFILWVRKNPAKFQPNFCKISLRKKKITDKLLHEREEKLHRILSRLWPSQLFRARWFLSPFPVSFYRKYRL